MWIEVVQVEGHRRKVPWEELRVRDFDMFEV